jgi:epoxyqueuosine reductase QueG
MGLDFFGVADLTGARDFIMAQGGEHIARFPRAISIGFRLLDGVMNEVYRHEDPRAILSYRNLYSVSNSVLDTTAMLIAKKIQAIGFRAYTISAAMNVTNRGKFEGAFSHKLAAHLAGLGWIGKNSLLVTPDCGPRIRLSSVLTDAPLETGIPLPDGCGDCSKCVEVCPVGAFTGVRFDPSEPRDVRFKAQLCHEYEIHREQKFEAIAKGMEMCGLCVHICPYGKFARMGRKIHRTNSRAEAWERSPSYAVNDVPTSNTTGVVDGCGIACC